MDINWATIGWIAGLLFVYLFGLIEGRSTGYKKRRAEEEQERMTRMAVRPSKPEIRAITVDDPGLLRVRNEEGTYTLDLDGTRLDPAALDASQRKRLIEILTMMRPWLEQKPSAQTKSKQVPPPPAAAPPPVPEPARPMTPLSSPPPAAEPASPRGSTPSKPATIAKEDRPAVPATSIVHQIDAILQARLAGTPLEDRGVFLTQSAEGGVSVYVGLARYSSLNEIPDPEIKAVIRAAITEWEDKYTPGLSR